MNTLRNRPWPVIKEQLQKKYNIVGEIDLLEVDYDPYLLYQSLKDVYKAHYEPNDRILIYHYDVDYYHGTGSSGFTLTNLFTCLSWLDISINFCLLLTSHYGISREIAELSRDELPMPVFESNYTLLQTDPSPNHIEIDIEKIQKPYICLNGAQRSHRVLFLSYLKEHQLLDKGILSWHFDQKRNNRQQAVTVVDNEIPNVSFVTTVPFTRLNDRFDTDDISKEIYRDHHEFFRGNYKNHLITGNHNENRWDLPAIQHAFLYVSIETVMQYPYPYLTEKTFRSILHKRPFVIVGAPSSLGQIKKLGFRTFDKVWNESYDLLENPNQRIRHVIEILKQICSLSADDLQSLMYNVKETVEFNYQFYIEKFSKQILNHRLTTL